MTTNRRQFLMTSAAGAGALALTSSLAPLMAAPLRAAPVSTGAPRRFIFIRKSNGTFPSALALPTFSEQQKAIDDNKEALEVDLDRHELPEWLRALDGYKQHMTILQGLSTKMSQNGHYSYSSVMGAMNSGGDSVSGIKRATVDFELARLFPSPFGHVELSFAQDRTGIVPGFSAPAPHQRNYCYADPRTAYDELFKSVVDPDGVDSENQMLGLLENEERFKAQAITGYEKLKLSGYVDSLEAIRARNKKLEKMSASIQEQLPTLGAIHADGGLNANTLEKQAAMTDILVAALVTGLTNVVTYTIDDLKTGITGLPGNEADQIGLHDVGHNKSYSGVTAVEVREKVRVQHIRQVATIIDRLKAVPEGQGNMFDNTMIMYFPEGGETHHAHGTEAPFVIMAGDNCKLVDIAGRYIRLPYHATEGHKTLGNWYTTLLNAHGNPIKHYGDLDLEMSRKKMAQTGAIERFMG